MKHISDYILEYRQRAEQADGVTAVAPHDLEAICPTCGGVGYIRQELPINHPLFGLLQPCPNCNNGGGVTDPDRYGLLPADRGLAWSDVIDVEPSISGAREAVKELMARKWGFAYLYGGYGTAKTTILKVAVAEYLRAALPAAYMRLIDIMDELRAAYDATNPQVEALARIRWFSSLPLLAIDEFEKVNETGFITERRFEILDTRYEAATRQHYGITLIAANVPPAKLPPAIASRVNDERFVIVPITSKDMRLFGKDFDVERPNG